MVRKAIPKKVEKQIFKEANSSCPFCGEQDVNTLEIHHIKPVSEGGTNETGNLLLTCSNCHSKITEGKISQGDAYQKKILILSGENTNGPSYSKAKGDVKLVQSINKGVVAHSVNTVNIKTSKSPTIKTLPPIGTIGSEFEKRNYVKHLIDRYHEFKKADKTLNKMNYTILHRTIQRNFGAKIDLISLSKFEELVEYLKNRIDSTILGKSNRKHGKKSYSSFEEFLRK